MKKLNNNGITLIALVITIIVLLILATVTLSMVIGNSGIFNKANIAKENTNEKTAVEEIRLIVLEVQSEKNGKATLKDIVERLKEDKQNTYIINYNKKTAKLDSKGDIIETNFAQDDTYEGKEKIYVTNIKNGYEVEITKNLLVKSTSTKIESGGASEDESKDPVIADKSGACIPNVNKIAQKTYVTWTLNSEGTEYVMNDTHTTPPTDWYDYENGKWANIKTTNNGLEAYWVWIPRYEYVVPTSETATEIDVKFIPITQKEADEGYTIHPAFTNDGNGGFGDLEGIWVAKFEASSNTPNPDENRGGGADETLKVQVKPGVQSWRSVGGSVMFKVCRKMTDVGEVLAGSSVDSHMMKNTEWGSVAILSQSKYGVYNPQSSTGEMRRSRG